MKTEQNRKKEKTRYKARKEKQEEKQQHGRLIRMTKDETNENSWTWLQKGNFNRKT